MMKKKTKLLAGIIAFVLLFYNQNMGINLSLFCMLIGGLLCFKTTPVRKDRTFWLLIAALIVSAFAFAWYGDAFSFWALLFSVLSVGLYGQYPKLNSLLYPALFFTNFITFIYRIFLLKNWKPQNNSENAWWQKAIAYFLIPAVFLFIFVLIYSNGSSSFQSFFQQFTSLSDAGEIIILSVVGFFFMFNYWYFFIPKKAIQFNRQLGNQYQPSTRISLKPTFHFLEMPLERKSGEISLILLNLLLLFFVCTYNYEQFFQSQAGMNLSNEIHQRVNTIIFSIIMAVGVILFYFKSAFNFDVKAGFLKKLAIIWIILNALLIISAFIKNGEYIIYFGLTFKRIGVFIFLALSLIGLVFTYIKIKKRKTNSYLLHKMIQLFFATFVICSTINFSSVVTKYNLTFHKNEDPAYLRSLEYNKQLLYDTYNNNPEWISYFEKEKKNVQLKKQLSFLSSSLYYSWVNMDD